MSEQHEIAPTGNAAGAATAPGRTSSLNSAGATAPAAFSVARENMSRARAERWKHGRSWTPERDAIVIREYAGWTLNADIMAMVNALPGQPVSERAVKWRAYIIGVKRPDGFAAHALAAAWKRNPRARSKPPIQPPRTWMPERDAMFRREWPLGIISVDDLLAMLQALPGKPLKRRSLFERGIHLGLRRARFAAPKLVPHRPAKRADYPSGIVNGTPGTESTEAGHTRGGTVPAPGYQRLSANGARIDVVLPPATDEPPPPYDPARPGSVEARMEKARAMLRAKRDPSQVVQHTRLPLRDVYRLLAELRAS